MSADTGRSTAAAIRPTVAIISATGIFSPSGYPADAAMEWLAVARARVPGVPATTVAVMTSQTFTTTSSSGASWSRCSSEARSAVRAREGPGVSVIPRR